MPKLDSLSNLLLTTLNLLLNALRFIEICLPDFRPVLGFILFYASNPALP